MQHSKYTDVLPTGRKRIPVLMGKMMLLSTSTRHTKKKGEQKRETETSYCFIKSDGARLRVLLQIKKSATERINTRKSGRKIIKVFVFTILILKISNQETFEAMSLKT